MNAPTDPLTSGKPDAPDLAAILATSGQKQKRGRGKWLLVLCLVLIGGGLGSIFTAPATVNSSTIRRKLQRPVTCR